MKGETTGGQLGDYVKSWEHLDAPSKLLKILKGYLIPFSRKPPLLCLHQPLSPRLATPPSPEMDSVVKSLLSQNMVAVARERSGFICPMFLVKKGDGTMRPVFNLKSLNSYVTTKKFKLINHQKIPLFLQKNDYLATIDLSQAYCHIPIARRHRRFLCFLYKGTVYQWTCLPFGLASAPQAFAQLSNWVAA